MEEKKRTIKSIERDGTMRRGRIRAELEALKLKKAGHERTQHVVPGMKQGWEVKQGGEADVLDHFPTKQEAVDFARRSAQKAGRELIIHKKDGTVQRIQRFDSESDA